LLPKKKTSSGFEFVSGLADGASAMPAKWSRPVFSFGFYERKISRAFGRDPAKFGIEGWLRMHSPAPQDWAAAANAARVLPGRMPMVSTAIFPPTLTIAGLRTCERPTAWLGI
jgi:hypothetical protein